MDPLGDLFHPSARIVIAQADAGTLSKKKNVPDVPLTLETFSKDDDTGEYGVSEMNDALLTVFGEISATLDATLEKEARAVASTIFNRLSEIKKWRAACVEARRNWTKPKKYAIERTPNTRM